MSKEKQNKTRNYWKVAFMILLILIVIAGFFAWGYHQTSLEKKYVEGGKDALNSIISTINTSGGVTLNLGENNTISIAKYDK